MEPTQAASAAASPSHSPPLVPDANSNSSSHTSSNGIGVSSASSAPPPPAPGLVWPSLQSLLLDSPCDAEQLPYVTYEEAEHAAGEDRTQHEDGDDGDEHWLDAAFSSSCCFSSPLASRSSASTPPSSAPPSLTAALRFLQQRHRAHIERHHLSSPAWQQLKRNTAQFLADCDRAQALPAADKRLLSAADIAAVDSNAVVKLLNPLLTPCIPPLPPPMSAAPRAPAALFVAERSRERRRMMSSPSAADSSVSSRPLSAQLLSGPLGRHVLQLLHIHALKRSIEQEHGAMLDSLVQEKQRSNAETIRRQQEKLAERERRRQQIAESLPAAAPPALDAASLPPPSLGGAMTDVAPAAAASMPPLEAPSPSASSRPSPPAAPPRADSDSLVSLSFALSSAPSAASLLPAAPAADSMSERQLVSSLPPILSVFFLHRGFICFSRSALLVMAQTSIDFIRRAGRAIRDWADDRAQGRRRSSRRQKAAAAVSSASPQNGHADDAAAERTAAGRRLLRQLGIDSERGLHSWYEHAVVSAGARIRRTELRLLHLQRRVAAAAEPMSLIAEEAEGGFGCEPFSPLRSCVSPPALPSSPTPLEDEKSEVQQERADSNSSLQQDVGKTAAEAQDGIAGGDRGGAQDASAMSDLDVAAAVSAAHSGGELSSSAATVEGLATDAVPSPDSSSSVRADDQQQSQSPPQQERSLPAMLDSQRMPG